MNSTVHISNYMMEWKLVELSTLTHNPASSAAPCEDSLDMTWCSVMMLYIVNIMYTTHTNNAGVDADQGQCLTHFCLCGFRNRVQSCLPHYLCPRRLKRRHWITHPPMTNWTHPPPSPLWWPQPMRAPPRPTPRSRQTLRSMTLCLVTFCHHLLTPCSL